MLPNLKTKTKNKNANSNRVLEQLVISTDIITAPSVIQNAHFNGTRALQNRKQNIAQKPTYSYKKPKTIPKSRQEKPLTVADLQATTSHRLSLTSIDNTKHLTNNIHKGYPYYKKNKPEWRPPADKEEPETKIILKPITRLGKYGIVPAPPGDGSDIWDNSELLHLKRIQMAETREFHRHRRKLFTKKVWARCKALRQKHSARPIDLGASLKNRLPKVLVQKYALFLQDILHELETRTVKPTKLPRLGKRTRKPICVGKRIAWISKARSALNKAMTSFPPGVRRVMAEVLRPLQTFSLVDVVQGSSIGISEGVDLKVLITSWKAIARSQRDFLRQKWFLEAVAAIRKASKDSGLSQSRSHTVIYAFNNLLASKLQQVLIRSVEEFLEWLGSDEEPWIGPRIKVNIVLVNDEVTLQPDENEVFDAFIGYFEELLDCVQLYRASWEEPKPPAIPQWRLKLAEKDEDDPEYRPLRPLQPQYDPLVVALSDTQWESLKANAGDSLNRTFQNTRQFVNQIADDWKRVICGDIDEEVDQFLQSDATLQEFANQINNYSLYVEKASHVPTAATVAAFRLEYKAIRQSLLNISNGFVTKLRHNLISGHRSITKSLKNEFQMIATRIQEVPQTTQELFTLMGAVEEARRITIRRLIDDVCLMSERLQIILDVVVLTEEDLTETAEVIKWPARIRPTVEKSVESLEDYKQTFEEALTAKTAEVNHNLLRIEELVNELEELAEVPKVNKYIREVRKIEERIEKVKKLVVWVAQEESLFKLTPSSFNQLETLENSLVPYAELFTLVLRWRNDEKHWMDGDFTSLDPEFIDTETEEISRDLTIVQKTFKSKFKQQALDGDPKKARINLEDSNPDNLPGPLRIACETLNQIRHFRKDLPLISVLCNKGLRERHWEKMNAIAGFDITPNAGTSLRKVVKMQLDPMLKQFEVVSGAASREYNLELSLYSMRKMWTTVKLKFIQHPNLDIEVLDGLEDLSCMVEDHLIKTHAITNSPFVKPFIDQVIIWEDTLRKARKNVREWLRVQSLWVEMCPLFSMADLSSQLPQANKAFKEIDDGWRKSMTSLMETTDILSSVSESDNFSQAASFLEGLEGLQSAVHSYLNNKRSVFPRLFFMSNEELTALVCEKSPTQLGAHLPKSFDGVYQLQLDDDFYVKCVLSAEGEVLQLNKKLSTRHAQLSIENWLLEQHLTQTMKKKVNLTYDWWDKNCSGKIFTSDLLLELISSFPLQIILTIRHIFLTSEVQEAIRGGREALSQCLKRVKADLGNLVDTVRGDFSTQKLSYISSPRKPSISTNSSPFSSPRDGSSTSRKSASLPGWLKGSLTTLILSYVHSRDYLENLINEEVEDESAFAWQSQLRLFLDDGPSIEANLLEVTLPWGWEYVGAGGRLVSTPLTTRAHLALAIAYKSHLGAAHEGPAGTGKTETVKDLARVLAMHCIVFNCSESVDPRGVASLLTGMAAAGSWLCLDEFNKFQVGVLSVAAQQLLTVISARRSMESTFSLSGMSPLALDPKGLMVVTLNPDYKGRVSIPDNLTLLLRPVAMLAADEQAIVEVWLLATGFRCARSLAIQSTRALQECRTRLAPQSHYDFGLRSVRAVLTAAGRLREELPDWGETEVMVRAIRDVNQPKLVGKDSCRFEAILEDFFTQLPSTPRPPAIELKKHYDNVCRQMGIYATKEFESKCFQLLTTIRERTGILLVGESCSSKSTIIKALFDTLNSIDTENLIHMELINPKTVNQSLLVGHLDPSSREWTDGRVTIALRRSQKSRVWIVLDGPADAAWVEQFNTALDDSRRLCLASGETLSVPSTLNMIFEVRDLSQASPAAVSRCGVIYVSDTSLTWNMLFESWKRGMDNEFIENSWWSDHIELLEELVNWLIPCIERFIKLNCKYILPVKFISLIRPIFRITATQIEEVERLTPSTGKEKSRIFSLRTIAAFLFSFGWCVGGALDAPSRIKFSTYLRRIVYGEDKTVCIPPLVEKTGCPYPSEGNILEAAFDSRQRSLFRPWSDVVKHMTSDLTERFTDAIIHTPETVSLLHVIKVFEKSNVPLLIIGQGGSGRRAGISEYLKTLNISTHASIHVPVTPAASVHELKGRILRYMESRAFCSGNSKKTRRLIAFVDDIHLVSPDDYEARPVHEAVREAIQQKIWINTENTSKVDLQHVYWLAGCSLNVSKEDNANKCNIIDQRCLSSFIPITMQPLSDESLSNILSTKISTFLKVGNFVPDIFSVVTGVVSGLISVYKYCQQKFTPTLDQPHYSFSLVTTMNVLKGIFFAKKQNVESKRHFLRLWVYETMREMCDRLTRNEEEETVYQMLMAHITQNFKDKPKIIFDKLCNDDGSLDLKCVKKLKWSILCSKRTDKSFGNYEENFDEGKMINALNGFISEQKINSVSPLNIVVFQYVLEHISRACRVLARPSGHLLLVGDGGCGRKSLTKLSAYICKYHLESPQINAYDDYAAIRLAFKTTMKAAGLEESSSVVIISDDVIQHPKILHMIHSILYTGFAPGILSLEDISNLTERLRLSSDNPAIREDELWDIYIQRVKKFVHLVVTVPSTPMLSRVLAQYPALYLHTTVDYYQAWPEDALRKVGEQAVANLQFRLAMRDSIVYAAIQIHNLARNVSQDSSAKEGWCPKVTPASYLHFLQEFQGLYKFRKEKVLSLRNKYRSGLEKLDFASSQILVMKEMLASLEPQIQEAARDVTSMMIQIEKESTEVDTQRQTVAEEEEAAEYHAAKAKILQEECQSELNQALPALHAAESALNTLKPSDITLVKSMKSPPQVVKMVMSAVCVMLDIKPVKVKNASGKMVFDYWGSSKRLLGDMTFLQQLQDYDKDAITGTLMDKIQREYLDLPEFDPAIVSKASSAAEGLCKWVQAMAEYFEVAKIVAPKRERLAAAEAEVQELMMLLEKKRKQLQVLEERLEELQARFSIACAEKEKLEAEQLDCSIKLERAEKLIRGLGGEKERWEKEKALTEEALQKLPGDSLLAAASLGYLAPHTPSIRGVQTEAWSRSIQSFGLEVSTPFNIVKVLASPLDLRAWTLEGLPSDNFSAENAIFIKNSVKCPMLVDPDDQGTHWLERHEQVRDLIIVRAQDAGKLVESTYMGGPKISLLEDALAQSITTGKPLLLKDLHGDPPPIIQPLLQKCIVEEEGVQTIVLGNLKLQYHPNFRLYLATRQIRPSLPRETVNSINLINFTVTLHGLSDLLRQVLVQNERPELEDERERLATSACEVQRKLQETEERILQTLAASQGNILESEEAIQVLQDAKIMSDELKQKETEGRATEETIWEYCKKYEAVSRPAARLYLLTSSLSNLSVMYQFSLTWFMQLYIQVIKESGRSSVLERRLMLLQEKMLSTIHHAVVKSLSTEHRLPFSVMLSLHALRDPCNTGSIALRRNMEIFSMGSVLSEDEQTWLLQLSGKLGMEVSALNPPPEWLPTSLVSVWPLISSMLELDAFKDLDESFRLDKEQWEKYLHEEDPPLEMLPQRLWTMTPLQRLLLVSVVFPSQIIGTATFVVKEVLGPTFTSAPPLDLSLFLQLPIKGTSTASRPLPLMLITVPGVDPLQEILRLVTRRPDVTLTVVSLGQGQEELAETSIKNHLQTGGWVVLQNLHHARTWLMKLAAITTKILESYGSANANDEPHPDFRLILTTQASQDFPTNLLRQVEKIAVAPPIDAKAGLIAAVNLVVKECSTWGIDDLLDMDAEQAALLFRLLYGLGVFHVIVSERGRHGKRAWTVAPTFTQSDLSLALNCVRAMVEAGREMEKSAFEHLIGRIIYGGRVKRPQDEFVIISLLKEVLNVVFAVVGDDDSPRGDVPETDDAEDDEQSDEVELHHLFPDFIGELGDLLEFVKNIDSLENPNIFGLPRSVKSVQASKEGTDLLTALTNMSGTVEEFAPESGTTTNLLISIKNKLPSVFDIDQKFIDGLNNNDLVDILLRETDGINVTIRGIKTTIKYAIMLLKTGNSGGYEEIAEDIVKNVPSGRTPKIWSTFDSLPTPDMLQSFLNLLWMRTAFFQKWFTNGCPDTFWLGGFQFLPAFLSLVLRQAAVHYKVPLHKMEWKFYFTDEESPNPTQLLDEGCKNENNNVDQSNMSLRTDEIIQKETEKAVKKWEQLAVNGLSVFGLWLVGSIWDYSSKCLNEPSGRHMIQLLPLMKMIPVVVTENPESLSKELGTKCPETIPEEPDKKKTQIRFDETTDEMKSPREIRRINEEKNYKCPVYEGGPESSRSPMVFSIPLDAGPLMSNHWVQRRVTIYTSKH